jgi:GNAT superfamily N-acetyltransferase
MIEAPFDQDLQTFLRGPHLKRLIVDDLFGSPLDEIIEDNKTDIEGYPDWSLWAIATTSDVNSDIYYRSHDIGVVAFISGDVPIGCYLWTSLSVDPTYRKMGIGRELVILRCTLMKENPVWNLDQAAYSPAGLATHISAWNHINNQ